MTVDLGKILLEANRMGLEHVEAARRLAQSRNQPLDEALLSLSYIDEDGLADVLGKHFGIPGFSLARMPAPNPKVTALVPEVIARKCGVVPLEKAGKTLILLMADPTDISTVQAIRKQSELDVQPVVASFSTVRTALDSFYPQGPSKLLTSVLPFIGKLITEEAARTYRCIPVDREGNEVTVACAADDLDKTRRAIELATGLKARMVEAPWPDIERAITRVHAKKAVAPAAAPAAPEAGAPEPQAATPASPAAPAPAEPAASPVQSLDDLLGSGGGGGAPAPAAAAASAAPATSGPPPGGNLSLDLGGMGAAPDAEASGSDGLLTQGQLEQQAGGDGGGGGTLSLDLGDAAPAAPADGDSKMSQSELEEQAGVGPSPNLSAGGQEGGPKTGLAVEMTDRDQAKEIVAEAWGELDRKLAKLIPEKLARNYRIVAVLRRDKILQVAMEQPNDTFAVEAVEFASGLTCEVYPATPEQIEAGLFILYTPDEDGMAELLEDLEDIDLDDVEEREEFEGLNDLDAANASEQGPIVRLVNGLILNALNSRGSDIHLEPYEDDIRVRIRVDGQLREVMKLPLKFRDPVTSRIKIMGRMDISERRLPQDGRLRLLKDKAPIDFRISTMPTVFGEKMVLRILDRDKIQLDMVKLGFDPEPMSWFREAIHRPYGMVLVVGPSGCGKTNTLYSALADVNQPDVNIMTCEDPVEFSTAGLNQVQAVESIGLNFAAALRSFLRQDPNVILVGEIRDFETAEIAIKAALTGHMVLSTLHTNDAPACVNRLTNMGVEPFLIASSLHAVVAQRLVRRVCDNCNRPDTEIRLEQLVQMGFAPEAAPQVQPQIGGGCPNCEDSGYRGRVGLFEVLRVNDAIRELILCNASQMEIKDLAVRDGMDTMRQAGLAKIKDGVTSCEEVIRETIG
ncbi:MAG: ATPase, T2SS/T4P/T4SS family [Acidobacteriota bacterium]